MKRPHLEIVLPIYNEEENLAPLVRALDAATERLKERVTVGYLFVNDGSRDGSVAVLEKLHRQRSDVRVVDLVRNYGHGAALSAGVDHFDGDIAVFMDADLQDSPDAIPRMLTEWEKGARTVVAERGSRSESNRWAFRAFYFLLHRLARVLPPVDFGTFCLLDRTVVHRLRQLPERNRYFPGLVALTSGRITAVRLDREDRMHGHSRVGTLGLVNLAFTAFLSFSNAPVRLVSLLGIFCSIAAGLAGLTIIGIKILTDLAIPGWASMMTTLFLVGGMQCLCLGLIGEYVARIYEEVKSRPHYYVGRVLEKKAARKVA